MARKPYRELTDEQVQHFLERGYVVVEQALSRELAEQWRAFAFERLGYTLDDPATWAEERIHMPTMNRRRVAEVAPRERVVPEREARQARMLAEEKRRLGIA